MPFKTTPALRLVAKLYGLYDMSLDEIAAYLGDPKNRPQRDPLLTDGSPLIPAKNFSLRLIFRPTTSERVRQIVWKLWRIGRVARNV